MSGLVHYFLPRDIEGNEQLFALALDLQWSWSHSADELWNQIEKEGRSAPSCAILEAAQILWRQ